MTVTLIELPPPPGLIKKKGKEKKSYKYQILNNITRQ